MNLAIDLVDSVGRNSGSFDRDSTGGFLPNRTTGVLLGRLENSMSEALPSLEMIRIAAEG